MIQVYRQTKDKPRVFVLAAILFGLFMVSSLLFRHEVIRGNVWAMGVSLGGMSRAAAQDLIREKVFELEQGSITFVAGSRSVEVSSREIGLLLDESRLLESLEEHAASAPRIWPGFLSRLGSKKVMAAPIKVSLTDAAGALSRIAWELSAEPQEARYDFSGKELQILPPSDGQVVTEAAVAEALKDISGASVEVPFAAIPAPQSDELPALELIGEYSTPYDIEDTERNVNLSLAAQAVHGQILKPGEVYSFNEAAGERTEEKGYRWANVVVGDHLEPGLAGGICQVTTTLFDAAAFAGLDFPFATAHGIPVDYVPPGMDAAVAWDYLDLKVKNSTDGLVVFGAWVEDGQVTVRVFGKPDGCTYEIEPVTVAEYPSPGKRPGLVVETYRVKKVGGEVVERTLLMRNTYQPSYPPPAK